MTSFADFPLSPALLQALDGLGHATATPVQAASLPAILAGRDVIAQAPTGSGKTVAFALGLLQRLDPALVKPQALVLCPTRELADQVAKAIRRLASAIPNLKVQLLTGGVALAPQLASLRKDSHVVVGTPGRVQELSRKHALALGQVRTLVLDEADRMLDMGFEAPIREIVGRTPPRRQSLLFSATYPDAIRAIARDLLRDPLEVTVAGAAETPTIEQHFVEVELARKPDVLLALLREHRPESAVVFCNTRRDVDDVTAALVRAGVGALTLHGDVDQRDRDEVLVRFANRSCRVLVASDVAARGLDVENLAMVVNYELPPDADVYLHRIGRTARAGRSGLALSLVTPREMPRALELEARSGAPLRWAPARATNAADAKADGALAAAMVTLRLDAGRTDKMRPGDILGALTGDAGLPAEAVGKIDVFPTRSYVAIRRSDAAKALDRLRAGRIKGRNVRIARL
ncbi:MAG TPA: ATP-dependent RNA helicase DbpA [Dokdonella sp.]